MLVAASRTAHGERAPAAELVALANGMRLIGADGVAGRSDRTVVVSAAAADSR
jgi:hypothetical protein